MWILVALPACIPHAKLVVLDGSDIDLPTSVVEVQVQSLVSGPQSAAAQAAIEGFSAQTRRSKRLRLAELEPAAPRATVTLTQLTSDYQTSTIALPGTESNSDPAHVQLEMWVRTTWVFTGPDGAELDRVEDAYMLGRWAGEESGEPSITLDPMPSIVEATAELGFSAGVAYARRLTPTLESFARPYFKTGDPRLGWAHQSVRSGSWETAAKLWREAARDRDTPRHIQGRALHNLALYWEVRGDYRQAVRHADLAAAHHDNAHTVRYRSLLREQAIRQRALRQIEDNGGPGGAMTDLITKAEEGFRTVDVPDSVRQAATDHLRTWLNGERFADYHPQIQALVDHGRYDELLDAFRQVLPFGTGGRRGHVGVGPNRMNPHTVGTSVQGHADWLKTKFEGKIQVVIAYDVRRFDDVRGVYDSARPSPIHGVTSRDLAELAARIYAANGIHAHLLQRGFEPYLSTPELSFVIRELGAQGGLNISASHNPPDDNGVKVYDERGAQLVAPDDEALLNVVSQVVNAKIVTANEAYEARLAHVLDGQLHDRYLTETAGVAEDGSRDLQILYTPLHGTGVLHQSLARAGFSVQLHEPQASLDGRFPTVPQGVANPENPAAMANALEAASGMDLVFGTDPDADRLGCEVWHRGEWAHLTGNDIAVLVAHASCKRDFGSRKPLVIVTEVTTRLVRRVAEAAGATVIDDLLVGFKYIAHGLRMLETEGRWRGVLADKVTLAAAGEESHGVLVTSRIRDKDAAGGAVMLAALAATAKQEGKTLVDVLRGLQDRHGYVVNGQVSVRFEGATGASRMAQLLDRLRSHPPAELGGRRVIASFDHRDERGRFGPFRSNSDRASRNVVVYHLAEDKTAAVPYDSAARVILRPSGTEPKLKIYAEIQGLAGLDPAGRQAVDRALDALKTAAQGQLSG